MLRRSYSCSPTARTVPQLALAQGWRGLLTALVLAAPLLLGGCMIQSKVQGRYVEDQGECRDSAEGNISRYEKPNMTTKDRNAQLVTLFSNCMAKQGWQVAKPKRTTTTGPHGPLDPYGSTAKTTTTTSTGPVAQPGQQQQGLTQQQYQEQQQALIRQQQELAKQRQMVAANSQQAAEINRQQQQVLQQQMQLQQRWQAQQRAYEGVRTQGPVHTDTTPLSPSGGMPPLSQPGAHYQPARPYSAPQNYGSGAGRNF